MLKLNFAVLLVHDRNYFSNLYSKDSLFINVLGHISGKAQQ
jgi:hypothetical protein